LCRFLAKSTKKWQMDKCCVKHAPKWPTTRCVICWEDVQYNIFLNPVDFPAKKNVGEQLSFLILQRQIEGYQEGSRQGLFSYVI
jgi:hypothetical protein